MPSGQHHGSRARRALDRHDRAGRQPAVADQLVMTAVHAAAAIAYGGSAKTGVVRRERAHRDDALGPVGAHLGTRQPSAATLRRSAETAVAPLSTSSA
jgi:hypothetical protein